jgi:hypothetical protein
MLLHPTYNSGEQSYRERQRGMVQTEMSKSRFIGLDNRISFICSKTHHLSLERFIR